ncbi:MAG: hypothetical protein WKF80_03855 [Thermomicrobiales bacterium]
MIDTGDDGVLAIAATLAGRTTVAVHDLTGKGRKVTLSLDDLGTATLLLLGEGTRVSDEGDGPIELAAFAYGWFRIVPWVVSP